MKKKDLLNFDLVVCFVYKTNNLEIWINELKMYGKKHIIVDTLVPIDMHEKFPDVIFTNCIDKKAKNCFPIEYNVNFDGVNLLSTLDTFKIMENDIKIDYMLTYNKMIEKIQNNTDLYFSIKNSRVDWANLLSRYEGSNDYLKDNVFINICKKCYKRINNKILTPISTKNKLLTQKLRGRYNYLKDYFLVNILKRY